MAIFGMFTKLLAISSLLSNAWAASFMVVSGSSSKSELCLAVDGGNVGVDGAELTLERCADAVSSGDGRELWSMSDGHLSTSVGHKCVTRNENGAVVLGECDGASAWEFQGNGQLKMSGPGQLCLSQAGDGPGHADVALGAAAQASSTASALMHGASMAVDGQDASYWASAFGDTAPVFTIDFGDVQKIHSADIVWEFPAKAFSVALSDGGRWIEAYSTDTNVLRSSHVPLSGQQASKARVSMTEAHPLYGSFEGNQIYGIKSLRFFASRLTPVLEDCDKASQSGDARDKYFTTSAATYDPSASTALSAEQPALEAAKASLSSTVSDLMRVLPQIATCAAKHSFAKQGAKQAQSGRTRIGTRGSGRAKVRVADGDAEVDQLIAEARSAIMAARKDLLVAN